MALADVFVTFVQAGFTGIGVGATYYGLKPVIEFMTFNFSMQVSYILTSHFVCIFPNNVSFTLLIVFFFSFLAK